MLFCFASCEEREGKGGGGGGGGWTYALAKLLELVLLKVAALLDVLEPSVQFVVLDRHDAKVVWWMWVLVLGFFLFAVWLQKKKAAS